RAMRAVNDNPVASRLMGVRVATVVAATWILSGAAGGIAGALILPKLTLTPSSLDLVLLSAFVGVVLGGIDSIAGAVVGCVVLGVFQSLVSAYLPVGYTNTYLLIFLVLVMAVRPQGFFGKKVLPKDPFGKSNVGRSPAAASKNEHAIIRGARRVGDWVVHHEGTDMIVISVLFLVWMEIATPYWRDTMLSAIATIPAVLGLVILSGHTSQLSVGQVAFLAVGAYTTAQLVNHGWDLLAALIVSCLLSAVLGLILGIATTRLTGPYLALVTLALAFATPEILLNATKFTGGYLGLSISSVKLAGIALDDSTSTYLGLFVLASLGALGAYLCVSRRFGMRMRAARDNEMGALAAGLRPARYRVVAFVISGALACLSGGLMAVQATYISPTGYGLTQALLPLLAAVIFGRESLAAGMLGAVFVTIIPAIFAGAGGGWSGLIFGLLLIASLAARNGVGALFRRLAVLRSRWNPDLPEMSPLAQPPVEMTK
ncbi:MAG: ABC transporter permease, partial [Nocardioidaceae bacterium]